MKKQLLIDEVEKLLKVHPDSNRLLLLSHYLASNKVDKKNENDEISYGEFISSLPSEKQKLFSKDWFAGNSPTLPLFKKFKGRIIKGAELPQGKHYKFNDIAELTIEGDLAAGITIEVSDGYIRIRGKVGKGTKIKARNGIYIYEDIADDCEFICDDGVIVAKKRTGQKCKFIAKKKKLILLQGTQGVGVTIIESETPQPQVSAEQQQKVATYRSETSQLLDIYQSTYVTAKLDEWKTPADLNESYKQTLRSMYQTLKYPLASSHQNLLQKLRAQQLNFLIEYCNAWMKNQPNVVVMQATGSGKTVAMAALSSLLIDRKRTKNKILIMVPRVALIEQTINTYQRYAPHLKIAEYGKNTGWYNDDVDVVVCTLQTVINGDFVDREFPSNHGPKKFKDLFTIVYLDEAHNFLGNKGSEKVTNTFLKNKIPTLAFTATPVNDARTPEKDLPNSVYKLLGYTRPADNPITPFTMNMASDQKVIAPICCGVVRPVISPELQLELNREAGGTEAGYGDLNESHMGILLNKPIFNNMIVDLYANGINPKTGVRLITQQGMTFAGGINHAEDLAVAYRKHLPIENDPHLKEMREKFVMNSFNLDFDAHLKKYKIPDKLREATKKDFERTYKFDEVRKTFRVAEAIHSGRYSFYLDLNQILEALRTKSFVYKDKETDENIYYQLTSKDIEHLTKDLNAGKVSKLEVGRQLTDEDKQEIFERYRRGGILNIVGAAMLREGFDNPATKFVINAMPTKSTIVAIQRGGRCGRLDPNDPDSVATIIDIDLKIPGQLYFSDVTGAWQLGEIEERHKVKNAKNIPNYNIPNQIDHSPIIWQEDDVLRLPRHIPKARMQHTSGNAKKQEEQKEQKVEEMLEELDKRVADLLPMMGGLEKRLESITAIHKSKPTLKRNVPTASQSDGSSNKKRVAYVSSGVQTRSYEEKLKKVANVTNSLNEKIQGILDALEEAADTDGNDLTKQKRQRKENNDTTATKKTKETIVNETHAVEVHDALKTLRNLQTKLIRLQTGGARTSSHTTISTGESDVIPVEETDIDDIQNDLGQIINELRTTNFSVLTKAIDQSIEAREQKRKQKLEEQAKAKAEAELKAKSEAEEQAKAKTEAELKAKSEAEQQAKAKTEAELKAKRDAEQQAKAKVEAELKAKSEAEQQAKAKAEAELKAKREAEVQAKAEAELKEREAEERAKAKDLEEFEASLLAELGTEEANPISPEIAETPSDTVITGDFDSASDFAQKCIDAEAATVKALQSFNPETEVAPVSWNPFIIRQIIHLAITKNELFHLLRIPPYLLVKYSKHLPKINLFELFFLNSRVPVDVAFLKVFENENFFASYDVSGNTLLHHAAMHCNYTVMLYLIKTKKFDINARNKAGETPLHVVGRYVTKTDNENDIYFASVITLFANGADQNIKASPTLQHPDGPKAFELLPSHIQTELKDYFDTANISIPPRRKISFQFTYDNLINIFYILRFDSASINVPIDSGNNILWWFINRENPKRFLIMMIAFGIDINHKNDKGQTPLYQFLKGIYRSSGYLKKINIDILQLLYSYQANHNIYAKNGQTPITNSVSAFHDSNKDEPKNIHKFMQHKHELLTTVESSAGIVLHEDAQVLFDEEPDRIIVNDFDFILSRNPFLVNYRNSDGDTLLHKIARSKNRSRALLCESLMRYSASPFDLNYAGQTVLDQVEPYFKAELLKMYKEILSKKNQETIQNAPQESAANVSKKKRTSQVAVIQEAPAEKERKTNQVPTSNALSPSMAVANAKAKKQIEADKKYVIDCKVINLNTITPENVTNPYLIYRIIETSKLTNNLSLLLKILPFFIIKYRKHIDSINLFDFYLEYGDANIDVATLKYFEKNKCDLEALDRNGNTFLHRAAKWCNGPALLYLLKTKRINIHAKNKQGLTAINVLGSHLDSKSKASYFYAPFIFLLAHGAKPEAGFIPTYFHEELKPYFVRRPTLINHAITAECVNEPAYQLFYKLSANPAAADTIIDNEGNTLLSKFIYHYKHVIVALAFGADINYKNKLGQTPLFRIYEGESKENSRFPHLNISHLRFLYNYGANHNLHANNGHMPITYEKSALYTKGSLELQKYLADKNRILISIESVDGNVLSDDTKRIFETDFATIAAPLFSIALMRNPLLVNFRDDNGNTIFHKIVTSNNPAKKALCKLLIQYSASPFDQNYGGNTVLDLVDDQTKDELLNEYEYFLTQKFLNESPQVSPLPNAPEPKKRAAEIQIAAISEPQLKKSSTNHAIDQMVHHDIRVKLARNEFLKKCPIDLLADETKSPTVRPIVIKRIIEDSLSRKLLDALYLIPQPLLFKYRKHLPNINLYDFYVKKSNDAVNLALLKFIENSGFNLNHTDNVGNTLLHRAALECDAAAILYLVKTRKIDINARNLFGETALHVAVQNLKKGDAVTDNINFVAIIALLAHGADLKAQTTQSDSGMAGLVPFDLIPNTHKQLFKPYFDVAATENPIKQNFTSLSDNPVDLFYTYLNKELINQPIDDSGNHLVAKYINNPKYQVHILVALACGADINRRNMSSETVLHHFYSSVGAANLNINMDLLKTLYRLGADHTIKSFNDTTPLDSMRSLLRLNDNLNKFISQKENLLNIIESTGNPVIDDFSFSIFKSSFKTVTLPTLKHALSANPLLVIYVDDDDGNTLLHKIATSNNPQKLELCQALIEFSASPYEMNYTGKTCIDLVNDPFKTQLAQMYQSRLDLITPQPVAQTPAAAVVSTLKRVGVFAEEKTIPAEDLSLADNAGNHPLSEEYLNQLGNELDALLKGL